MFAVALATGHFDPVCSVSSLGVVYPDLACSVVMECPGMSHEAEMEDIRIDFAFVGTGIRVCLCCCGIVSQAQVHQVGFVIGDRTAQEPVDVAGVAAPRTEVVESPYFARNGASAIQKPVEAQNAGLALGQESVGSITCGQGELEIRIRIFIEEDIGLCCPRIIVYGRIPIPDKAPCLRGRAVLHERRIGQVVERLWESSMPINTEQGGQDCLK